MSLPLPLHTTCATLRPAHPGELKHQAAEARVYAIRVPPSRI